MEYVIFWLVFLVIMVLIELATLGLTTIWFAGGALAGVLFAVLGTPFYVQLAAALAVSVVLLLFTRPLAQKHFNRDRIKTNTESLIGKQAVVLSEVNNLEGKGQVTIGGMEWSARATEEGTTIPEGAVVRVVAINGVKLIVEERKEEN